MDSKPLRLKAVDVERLENTSPVVAVLGPPLDVVGTLTCPEPQPETVCCAYTCHCPADTSCCALTACLTLPPRETLGTATQAATDAAEAVGVKARLAGASVVEF